MVHWHVIDEVASAWQREEAETCLSLDLSEYLNVHPEIASLVTV